MLLALDTSTRSIGIALYDGSQVLSESVWSSQDYHTVELAPAIADALQKTGVGITDLKALVVALGPGSFTGLRIGLAVAKGIALAQRVPIIGVPTLDGLAAAQPLLEIPLVAVLRAGRGRLAASWYRAGKREWESQGDVEVLTVDDLVQRVETPTLVCGELSPEERDQLFGHRKKIKLASPAFSLRRPSFLAEIGWRRWVKGQLDDPATLSPIYLHDKQPLPDGGQ